jgi:anti-sigma regulatory factor (Ser/Thr protein kinase)
MYTKLQGEVNKQSKHFPTAYDVSDAKELSQVRSKLTAYLQAHEVSEQLIERTVWAVNEVATNGLRHGQAPVCVTLWMTKAANGLPCFSVRDKGCGFRLQDALQAHDNDEIPYRHGLKAVCKDGLITEPYVTANSCTVTVRMYAAKESN